MLGKHIYALMFFTKYMSIFINTRIMCAWEALVPFGRLVLLFLVVKSFVLSCHWNRRLAKLFLLMRHMIMICCWWSFFFLSSFFSFFSRESACFSYFLFFFNFVIMFFIFYSHPWPLNYKILYVIFSNSVLILGFLFFFSCSFC